MSRDKQIEEMAKVISTLPPLEIYGARSYGKKIFLVTHLAEHLYIHDYRKASDVAEEIFAEIEDTLDRCAKDNGAMIIWALAELKKKYIGKDTNVTTKTEEGNEQ